MPDVRVELFLEGQGPCHTFTATLQGWDLNRLDLQSIMEAYHLKALYAFSLSSGRGQRLQYNPRNGLSVLAYSGKPGALVRLDGDPKASFLWSLGKTLFAAAVIGFIVYLLVSNSLSQWVHRLRESGGGHLTWIVCFFIMIYTQLVWRPLRRKKKLR